MTDDNQPNGPGRPAELADGKRVNIYIDGNSLEIATRLGGGNFSLGIRLALEASKPAPTASIIEQIWSRHIRNNANVFLDDLEEVIKCLAASEQGRALLTYLDLDDPDLIQKLRQRDSFELAAPKEFRCFKLWGDKYIATHLSEVKQYLERTGGKLWEEEVFESGGYYSVDDFREALEKWLENEDGFSQARDTPEEAWKDACARHSIPPVELKPENYYIVSDDLATELSKRGEIVSQKLIGEYRVWGCLTEVHNPSDLVNVKVLVEIAKSREARDKLLR